MGLLSNLQWNVTKPRARFSAELQAPLQPAAAPPDAVPPETPLPEKKYPAGHTTEHLQSWKLHKELTLQDAFSSWEIQEVFFSSHSSQNRCVRSACIFFIYFFFFSSDQPKGAMGMALASGAHTSTVVNNNHASTNPLWLASGPMCVKGWRRKPWKSPNQLRKEQPVLLEVIRWGIKGTLH